MSKRNCDYNILFGIKEIIKWSDIRDISKYGGGLLEATTL